MKLLPIPNATDPTGTNQYNYVYQTEQDWPRNDQVLRVDWNAATSTVVYGRLQFGYEKRSGGVSILGSTGGWPQMATKYEIDTVGYVNTVLHTFSPTLFGEFTVGVNWSHQNTSPVDQAAADATTGGGPAWMPQFFRRRTRLLVPAGDFGGVPGTCVVRHRAAVPFFGVHALFNIAATSPRPRAAHPEGGPLHRSARRGRPSARRASAGPTTSTPGSNPRNTNIGVANALLGAITEYRVRRPSAGACQFFLTEWYGQDTWRLKRTSPWMPASASTT
jgi:hypothetical protein